MVTKSKQTTRIRWSIEINDIVLGTVGETTAHESSVASVVWGETFLVQCHETFMFWTTAMEPRFVLVGLPRTEIISVKGLFDTALERERERERDRNQNQLFILPRALESTGAIQSHRSANLLCLSCGRFHQSALNRYGWKPPKRNGIR